MVLLIAHHSVCLSFVSNKRDYPSCGHQQIKQQKQVYKGMTSKVTLDEVNLILPRGLHLFP